MTRLYVRRQRVSVCYWTAMVKINEHLNTYG